MGIVLSTFILATTEGDVEEDRPELRARRPEEPQQTRQRRHQRHRDEHGRDGAVGREQLFGHRRKQAQEGMRPGGARARSTPSPKKG